MFSIPSYRLLARGVSKRKCCRSWGLGSQRFFFFTRLVILLWIQSRTTVQHALQVELFLHLSQADSRVSSPEHHLSLASFSARTFCLRGSDRWPGCHDTSLNCSFSSLPSDWERLSPPNLSECRHTHCGLLSQCSESWSWLILPLSGLPAWK